MYCATCCVFYTVIPTPVLRNAHSVYRLHPNVVGHFSTPWPLFSRRADSTSHSPVGVSLSPNPAELSLLSSSPAGLPVLYSSPEGLSILYPFYLAPRALCLPVSTLPCPHGGLSPSPAGLSLLYPSPIGLCLPAPQGCLYFTLAPQGSVSQPHRAVSTLP